MKNVVTANEMRDAEKAMNSRGIDNGMLRFCAALCVADGLIDRAKGDGIKTAVFCGSGGNGADGLLAAARLSRQGCNVSAYIVGDFASACKKLEPYTEFAKVAGVPLIPASEYGGGAHNVVDAIFGIGLNRPIDGEVKELINKLNGEKSFRLAVDIPSGIEATTGEVLGVAFSAHVTMTFAAYKRGMLFGAGRDYCGKIIVEDVGIETKSKITVCDDGDFRTFKRMSNTHKGNYGKIYIIGGSAAMIGAPILSAAAAHAAYLNGAGTVTACVPDEHRVALSSRVTMSMMKFLKTDNDGFIVFDKQALDEIIGGSTAIDIGMGMGKAPELKRIIEYLCGNFTGTLVIDADGLNALAGDYAFLNKAKCKIILTPHIGEFKRLTGLDATIENAVALAKEVKGVVVLKSATTVITDGEDVRINITGTPAMAKGGTGDVLGGCIAGLSSSFNPFDAATIACYRNGLGAERAVSSYAELMLTPRDILKMANYPELFE
ncbi:MAG: NAD(P)H-hydrate dehydratase [Clostridiales bacterium]|nr:NAD(P)H-hydrate dehydratase [Clostridiales bacterium]